MRELFNTIKIKIIKIKIETIKIVPKCDGMNKNAITTFDFLAKENYAYLSRNIEVWQLQKIPILRTWARSLLSRKVAEYVFSNVKT